jgi:hypothetical protein
MMALSFTFAATAGAAAGTAPPSPLVPAEVAAMLKEHLGRWRTEGRIVSQGKVQSANATWECKSAVEGVGNVCTWKHEWADGRTDAALEIMGYDAALKTMSITRIGDNGVIGTVPVAVRGNTMTVRRELQTDGKTTVVVNEVIVKAPGEWVQHATTDVEGKRVYEMNNTHRRLNPTSGRTTQ